MWEQLLSNNIALSYISWLVLEYAIMIFVSSQNNNSWVLFRGSWFAGCNWGLVFWRSISMYKIHKAGLLMADHLTVETTVDPKQTFISTTKTSCRRVLLTPSSWRGKVEVYQPKHVFNDFAISANWSKTLRIAIIPLIAYSKIKRFPHILEGKDVLVLQTQVQGKTASFFDSTLNKVIQNNTYVLIEGTNPWVSCTDIWWLKILAKVRMNIGTIWWLVLSMFHQIQGLRKEKIMEFTIR